MAALPAASRTRAVVLHLAAGGRSLLAPILDRACALPVADRRPGRSGWPPAWSSSRRPIATCSCATGASRSPPGRRRTRRAPRST